MPKVTNKIEPCDIDYLLSKGWDNFGVSISTPNEIEQYDVDYLLDTNRDNFDVLRKLKTITEENFNNSFLGNNSGRFIRMITKGHYKSIFTTVARLNLLEESLKMLVKDSGFKGNLLSYLKYRRDKEDEFFDKYSEIIALIEELQHHKSKVDDHNLDDSQDNLSTDVNILITEEATSQIYRPSFKSKKVEEIDHDLKCANSKGEDSLVTSNLKKESRSSKKTFFHKKIDTCTLERFNNELREEFTRAIKKNDISFASKMYLTSKSIGNTTFKEESGKNYLFSTTHLSDTVLAIKHASDDSFLRNTLNFAKENKLLTDVFQRDCHHGKNLLQFARKQGVKAEVEKIIKECGIDSTKYISTNTNPLPQAGSHSFLQKHSGKVVLGTIGVLVFTTPVVACICLTASSLAVVAASITLSLVGLAMILYPLLAVTTSKGEEMWNKVSDKLSDLFVCESSQSKSVI